MEKVFDFHFHLLFKHYVTKGFDKKRNVETSRIAKILNDLLGGPFDSQSSPKQLSEIKSFLGVVSILSLEHAFANRISRLASTLPFNWEYVNKVKHGRTDYYSDFNIQVAEYLQDLAWLKEEPYNIEYLKRDDSKWKGQSVEQISKTLSQGDKRYLAFSIEGGHNLSNVPIRQGIPSRYPEMQMKAIQERGDIDFLSMNLCHLSYIPEQTLGGFSQGVNKLSSLAFASEDFCPKATLGLSELGKKVVRQALTHPEKAILIDIKHMSVYTRFHYYRYREKLATEFPDVARKPVITSHTGFCFTSITEFINRKRFRSASEVSGGVPVTKIESENIKIGRTDDRINSGLFGNPWTINLFDEEITEIMATKGMIGLSLDQRILGAAGIAVDSKRGRYFEGEFIAQPEWERLFREGTLPTVEKIFGEVAPSREERHTMLLCLHIVHAVRVGYATLEWKEGDSPWDHICIGSDFDGLINPINSVRNIKELYGLRALLIDYLPQAEKSLTSNKEIKALKRTPEGSIERKYLEDVVDKFMYYNGLRFIARFLRNWQ
jgi:microsomal dipeptidase-like Zn-dependent dipeptidase